MAGDPSSLNANLFCAPTMGTHCFGGEADCRMSASIFNHKVLVSGNRFSPTMSRAVGYVFNQDLTETHFGKCAYIWDGNDFSDLNGGCGALQPGGCNDTLSGFANLCTQTGEPHTCTRSDPEVQNHMCKCEPPTCSETYGSANPPATNTGNPCFYEMPGLVYGDSTQTNHLRDSLKQRVAFQAGRGDLASQWNEVVLDNHLLIPKLRSNPTNTILAFVCIPSANPSACHMASQMRDDFHNSYKVTGAGVPVVAIDTTVDFTTTGGPFKVPTQDSFIFA